MQHSYLEYISNCSSTKFKGIIQTAINILSTFELSKKEYEEYITILQEMVNEIGDSLNLDEVSNIISILDIKTQETLDKYKIESLSDDSKLVLTSEGNTRLAIISVILTITNEYLVQIQHERTHYINKILNSSI